MPRTDPKPRGQLLFVRWEPSPDGKDKWIRVTEDCYGNEIGREPEVERKPVVKVTRDGWVRVRTEWHRKRRDSYDFTLDRCDTPLKLLGWVHHLTEKVWFDNYVARDLIAAVCGRFGWNLHG